MGEERGGRRTGASRRDFLKIGAGAFAAGAVVVSAIEVPAFNSSSQDRQIDALNAQLGGLRQQAAQTTQLQSQATALQTQLATFSGFLFLNVDEQTTLESVVETIIPSDGSGPGAKEAGVIYFIDRAIAGEYGSGGSMYLRGPFFLPNNASPITVNGQTYAHGTPKQRVTAGTGYQYPMDLRFFWRYGTEALQDYANSEYGGNFQVLSPQQRSSVLSDLWANKPSSFNDIIPSDFAYELFFMTWAGFLADPLYGGNQNMVGWQLVGFNGTNRGDFYGEGKTPLSLATSSSPTPLQPASLGQFQQRPTGT